MKQHTCQITGFAANSVINMLRILNKIFGMIDQIIPNTEPCKKGPTYDTTSKCYHHQIAFPPLLHQTLSSK